MPLGRFLEISLAATDVAESLAFYESLGFVQASVGEAWPHPYAVVTDGRLSLGLHGADFESPLPTWVAPSLRERLAALAALGVTIDDARLDDVSLHQALLRDPSGQPLRLLEARTFSPPALSPAHSSALGYFEEFALATLDLAAASAFWERLGFVAFEPVLEPFAKSRRRQPRSQYRALRDRPAGAGAGVHRRGDAGTNRKPARPGPSLRAAPAA